MVYRGKPSAGCDACRKAKKRCDLEQPSCTRCRKLKKTCSGYRDTTQLQIHDESESVRAKVQRQKDICMPVRSVGHRHDSRSSISSTSGPSSASSTSSTNETTITEYSSYQNERDLALVGFRGVARLDQDSSLAVLPPIVPPSASKISKVPPKQIHGSLPDIPMTIKPPSDEAAINFFFSQFTSHLGQWSFLREMFKTQQPEPALDLAVRICGMASLDNIYGVGVGLNRCRPLYAAALRLLNAALRDPIRCKTDETLIAVHLLGVYELLACDSRESIMSWKAHMAGAKKVLQVRGKAQLKTYYGRQLFREHRAQIIIHAIWEDLDCPKFLWEWDDEVLKQSYPQEIVTMVPADSLGRITIDYARLRYKFRIRAITDAYAMSSSREIEQRMIQWSIDTLSNGGIWGYQQFNVPDSPHVWKGMVHGFCHPGVPGVWNLYRTVRIMLTRTQEQVLRRFELPTKDVEAQLAYLRGVRKAQADDICAAIPTQLGHAAPAPNSPCILVSAYGSIWPLFFAGTCALERVGTAAWKRVLAGNPLNEEATSEKTAQAAWIINRLVYISKHLGLRWADGLAATLNGDFQKYHNIPLGGREPLYGPDPWRRRLHESDLGPMMLQRWKRTVTEYGMIETQDGGAPERVLDGSDNGCK